MQGSAHSDGYRCGSCGTYIWNGTSHSCGITPNWLPAPAPSPMYTLQRCPVCEGRGNVPTGFYTRATGATSTAPETCQACDGKGILKVTIFGNVEKVS